MHIIYIICYMRYKYIFYTRVINIKYENIILKIIRKYNVKIDFLNDTPEKIYAYHTEEYAMHILPYDTFYFF